MIALRVRIAPSLVALVVALAPWWAAAIARAGERGGRWQGTSWGFELRSGASFRAGDEAITPAPLLGLGLRVCTLLTLIDAELFTTTAGFSRTTDAGRYDLRRTSVGLDLRLHPLFVRHLQGGFGDRLAAGLHLAIGVGLDLLSTRGPGPRPNDPSEPSDPNDPSRPIDRTDPSFAFAIGAGADVPLTEPNLRPWSLWLGVGWRMRFAGFPAGAPGLRDMDEHQLLVALGLRFHDLTFAHFPPPPELDDRDR